MSLTEKELDRIEKKVKRCKYTAEWFPTMHEIEQFIKPNPEKYTEFIIWMLNSVKGMKLTEEQKAVRKVLYDILYELSDDCEE